jgi:hypothetical protein
VTAAIITMLILGSEIDLKTALTCRWRGAIKQQVDTLLVAAIAFAWPKISYACPP